MAKHYENDIIVINQTKQEQMGMLSKHHKKMQVKPFDPAKYDCKVHVWNNKSFLKAKPKEFSILNKARRKIQVWQEPTMICQTKCPDRRPNWKSDVLFNAKDAVYGHTEDYIVRFVYLRGRYISRTFEGADSNITKWIQEMKSYVEEETGNVVDPSGEDFLVFYPDVSRCEEGKTYTVLYSKI